MPTYEYECEKCGGQFEADQKITDAPLTNCPAPDPRSVEERCRAFDDGTGCLYGGNQHPDRCRCQVEETGPNRGTPHKHYEDAPFACARCDCEAYVPELASACGGPVRRLIAGSTGFVLKGPGWFKSGGY